MIIFILALLLIPSMSFAAGNVDYWGYTLKSLGSLILVLGIIILFFYILRKLSYSGKISSSRIKVKGKVYLDNKHYLAIVEVDGKEMLLGISDTINTLKELKTNDEEN
ncbi:flagellar biosynthetic protein FliO [Hippea maritima]|uniref:Flagellar protein FliO n=1 Tax=Hippea maritima (strain ATCC 700847 / DSM 10411 / MH2) TaxID=760142 RepID=F2LVQ6_HIPMA|nr:flagellar biosynthetic protein FliO [Hippea maritima]AEA33840.1 flagellar protein FliO [Hippea maritima DSM 10411]